MIRRVRSSPRCSTSVTSSPWRSRRGKALMFLAGGWPVVGGRRRNLARVVLAADRVLELAHALAERPSHFREPLGAEHEQGDDQDDDETSDTDLRHTLSLASNDEHGEGPVEKRPVPFRCT